MKQAAIYSAVIAIGASIAFFVMRENSGNKEQHSNPISATLESRAAPASTAIPLDAPAAANHSTAQAAHDAPLEIPAPPGAERTVPGDELALWQIPDDAEAIEVEGIPATRFISDPKNLEQLQVGQTLILPVSIRGLPVSAKVGSTYNDPAGVQVWLAEIQDAQPGSNVIITRGVAETHVVIASDQGTYSAVINNHSGETTLINEGEIHARVAPFDDGVVVGAEEEVPPPVLD